MSNAAMSNLFLPSVQALLKDPEALEPGNKEALEATFEGAMGGQFGGFRKSPRKELGHSHGAIDGAPRRGLEFYVKGLVAS